MRIAVFSIALVIIAMGVVGFVAPEMGMALRREYVATLPYTVGAIRVATGILLIVVAPASRMPRAIRVLGMLVFAQGLIQTIGMPFVGRDRARAILEWEAMHPALLRVGALVALATGGFIAYAVRRPATRDPATGP